MTKENKQAIREQVIALRRLASRNTLTRVDEHDIRMIADCIDDVCLNESSDGHYLPEQRKKSNHG